MCCTTNGDAEDSGQYFEHEYMNREFQGTHSVAEFISDFEIYSKLVC